MNPDWGSTGIQLGVSADCGDGSLRVTVAIKNATNEIQEVFQAGLADPNADPLYQFMIGVPAGQVIELAPDEVFYYSADAADIIHPDTLRELVSATAIEFHAEFTPGGQDRIGSVYSSCP